MREFKHMYSYNDQENNRYIEWRAIAEDKLSEGFGEALLKRLDEIEGE
jgi:hypothetical protein